MMPIRLAHLLDKSITGDCARCSPKTLIFEDKLPMQDRLVGLAGTWSSLRTALTELLDDFQRAEADQLDAPSIEHAKRAIESFHDDIGRWFLPLDSSPHAK